MRQGVDDWLDDLASEEADAAEMRKANPREVVEVSGWALFYWNAFIDLMNDRSYVTETQFIPVPGSTPLPLSRSRPLPLQWATLKAYADHLDLSRDDFAIFAKLMRGMDLEFLLIASEQAKGANTDG